ncbi:MAG: prepilin peptidase [Treponema sp.]|nr:prepilin peptidase [Treponema sp.]
MTTKFLLRTFFFLLIAIPASISDIRKFRIPVVYVVAGIVVFVFADIAEFILLETKTCSFFYNHIAAALSSLLVYFAARVFSGNGLGKGDILFGLFSALYTGFYANMAATVFAALVGILFYLFLKVVQNKFHEENILRPIFVIPFVPFITAGALLSQFLL